MPKKNKSIPDDELARVIDGQISDAMSYAGSERAHHREMALKFFEGEVDFQAEAGRSTAVSRDVADLHGLILPSLLRVFFTAENVAVYEPTRPEHEEYADQATDLVNYIVMRECGGYRMFRDGFSDGLLIGNGILKHWWDKTPEYTTEEFQALDSASYAMMMEDKDLAEVLEHEEYPDPNFALPPELEAMIAQVGGPEMLEAAGMPIPQAEIYHDVKIKRIKSTGRLRAVAVPDEEFLIDRNAKALDETIRFCAHVSRVTRSDLVKEGFPKDKIADLPAYQQSELTDSRELRDDIYDESDNAPDKSTELVDRYECYVLMDFDGDGIAERRRIVAAGGLGKRHILVNEEWGDDLPFSDIVPDPRPHTWRGRGLYDDAADVQRIKTVALRGILDNTYQQLVPQWWVPDRSVKPESVAELVNPTFGGIIFGEPGGTMPPVPVQIPHIAPQIAPVLEYMDKVTRRRTGISEDAMALNLDALQSQTATAVAAVQDQAHSKTEEYARNIANFGGLKRFFGCCLKLIVKYQDRPKTARLRGKVVEVDPRGWDAGMEVTIQVGLGTGTRERDVAALSAIRNAMKEYVGIFGPFNEFCNVGHIADVDRKLVEAAGLSNPDSYFPNITQEQIAQMRQKAEQAPKQPDPKMMEAQAKLQIEQQKAQADTERDQARMQADVQLQREKAVADLQALRERNMIQVQADRERAEQELQLMREKASAEMQIAREKAQVDAELRYQEMMHEAQLTALANVNRTPPDLNIQPAV